MELTYKELGYISKITGVHAYPYAPKIDIFQSAEEKEAINQSLQQKGIFKEDDITDLGLLVFHILESTSKCREYIKWNHMWIFLYRESYVLIQALNKEELQIEQVGKEELLLMLLYHINNTGKIEEKKRRVRSFTKEQMQQFMEEHPEIEAFFYEKTEEEKRVAGTVYVHDGYLNLYQTDSEKLYLIPRSKVYSYLEEIITGGSNNAS